MKTTMAARSDRFSVEEDSVEAVDSAMDRNQDFKPSIRYASSSAKATVGTVTAVHTLIRQRILSDVQCFAIFTQTVSAKK